MESVTAFSPGGISSFFEPYQLRQNGKIPANLRIAARGGGFTTKKGIRTQVTACKSRKNKISVYINKNLRRDAYTTETVARFMLKQTDRKVALKIEHNVEIPVGAGYGTSAAGALSTALAMNELLRLGMTFDQVGYFAHVAEIECRTGLGTVGALMIGGCILQKEGGPPGLCRIDRIPIKPSFVLVSGCYGPISKTSVLNSKSISRKIGREGKKTMKLILSKPDLSNFLQKSEEFALRIGYMTKGIKKLVEVSKIAGAVGATQNMLGDAFHAVVEEDRADEALKALSRHMPREKLFISKIDFEGAKLL